MLWLLVVCGALAGQAALAASSVAAWGSGSFGQTNVPPDISNVVAVDGGGFHSLALRADGSVVAWGQNTAGQTNVPPEVTNAVAVAAGNRHTVALLASGRVRAWGDNVFGQTNVPPDLTNAVALAAGASINLAIRSDGTVVAWGRNSFGQTNVPANLSNVIAVAGGFSHCLALRQDGTVVAWGATNNGQTTVPFGLNHVIAIAAGGNHSLALRADGSLVAWGDGANGLTNLPVGLNAVAIAAGAHHSLALRADGVVFAWGLNSSGQTNVPPAIQGQVIAIGAGDNSNLAITGAWPGLQILGVTEDTKYSGHTATLRVLATGASLTYQWQFAGTNITEATNAQLVLPNVQSNDAGTHRVVVSNVWGTVASNVVLNVIDTAPIILAQPSSVTAFAGSTAAFQVTADGSRPLSYQWQFNGLNIGAATNASLMLSNLPLAAAGSYRCVVSNVFGAVPSATASLTLPPLTIAVQPQSQTVPALTNVSFQVVASGNGPFTYQWQKFGTNLTNGAGIFGAQTGTLTISNVLPAYPDSRYSVLVGNAFGTLSSSDAVLVVIPLVAWGNNSFGQTAIPLSLTNLVAIAAGGGHNLAVKADGTVVAWGLNGSGQTNIPPGLTNISAIAAGFQHSLALRSNGTVVAWGGNGLDQANVPPGLSNVTTMDTGGQHSLALKTNGTVVAWGENFYGQRNVPPGLSNVVAIAAGQLHSLALKADGTVVAWGRNDVGQTNVPPGLSDVTAIAAGANHCLALKADGTVVAWGLNDYGQTNTPTGLSNVVAISAGDYHSLALKADGSVQGWGLNNFGQTNPPTGLTNVAAIAAGGFHNLALLDDHRPKPIRPVPATVVEWRVEDGDLIAVPIAAQSGVTAIVAGDHHTVALKNNGSVLAWGYNWSGQTTVPAGAQSGVTAIAAGGRHTVALKNDGSVVAWGYNYRGQVTGTPTYDSPSSATASPVVLGSEVLSGVTAIAAGDSHTVALKSNGLVLAWGDNWAGQTTVPTDLGGVTAIAAGYDHTVALKNDGSVVAWGLNNVGQTTVPAAAQSGVTAIAAGDHYTLALKSDGSVVAWGESDDGDDGFNSIEMPAGLSGVIAIAAARFHAVAIVIPTAPTITTPPVSQTLDWSQVATFTVTATGFPLYYQWRKDGVNLAGATSATYSLMLAQTNQVGHYTVVVSNPAGSVTSAPPAVLTVNPVPPAITAQPVNQTVNVWQYTGFTVVATRAVSFQWRKDGVNLAGATSATYTLPFVETNQAGSYTVVVINPAGSVTSAPPAVLTVSPAPPGSVGSCGDNCIGQTVVAWGDNGAGQTTVPVAAQSGVTAIAAGGQHTVALKNDGSVVAWGDNSYGQTTVPVAAQSGVVAIAAGTHLTVALLGDDIPTLPVIGNDRPVLTVQPVSRTLVVGTTAQLAVMAVGAGPLHFQWQFNGANIAGATNNLLDFFNVQTNQAGNYFVVVSNALGAVTSRVAQVKVVVPAKVEPLPPSTSVLLGSNVTFSANADGTPPLIYQWRKNGENIPGATNSTFTLTNVQVSDGGAYTVVVKNDYGIATSDPTLLIVEVPPQAPGDNFAERVAISGTNGVLGGTNRFATKETGEPNHGGKAGGKSVWYTWRAPTNGIANFRTQGSVFDTLLGIYTGLTVSNLTTIATDEDLGGFFTSEVRFNAVLGTDYHIAVDGFAGGAGDFILSWELEITSDTLPVITTQPPSQTALAGADVTFSVAATGDGLTYQWLFNDVMMAGATNSSLTLSNVQSAEVGFYTVRVRNSVGREVESLAAALELVTGLRPVSQDKLEDLFPQNGFGGLLKLPPSKAGETFGVSLGTIAYQIVSNVRSTTQLGEPNPCDVIGGASQWLTLHPTASGVFRLDTIGSAINTVLTVYRSTNLLYLNTAQIACDDNGASDGRRSQLSFNATANTDYLVVVDGVNYERGTIRINWAFGIPPSTTNSLTPRYSLTLGASLTLRSPATNGVPPPRFQWHRNGQPISGATNAALSLNNLQSTNGGYYTVVVSNAVGSLTYGTDVAVETPTVLRAELKLADKKFKLWLPTPDANQTMVVETSYDLIHWVPLSLAATNQLDISITNASQQFFRTRSGP